MSDDLRQEFLAWQLMQKMNEIFIKSGSDLKMNPYKIWVTGCDCGMIEFVNESTSLDALKKNNPDKNLSEIYKIIWGDNLTPRKNFARSLAAYSIFTYLFSVRDRHNGNILVNSEGYIIHIDFGFFIYGSPGGVEFETAPFKLTHEFMEVMGGINGDLYSYFRALVLIGFIEIRKHIDEIMLIMELMSKSESKLPCFEGGNS